MMSYRYEVQPFVTSATVRILIHHQDVPEGEHGWFKNKEDAKNDAARRMSHLAEQLLREAHMLRRGPPHGE